MIPQFRLLLQLRTHLPQLTWPPQLTLLALPQFTPPWPALPHIVTGSYRGQTAQQLEAANSVLHPDSISAAAAHLAGMSRGLILHQPEVNKSVLHTNAISIAAAHQAGPCQGGESRSNFRNSVLKTHGTNKYI